ncbi:tail fiber assembly protein [Cronobacter dublinensis]
MASGLRLGVNVIVFRNFKINNELNKEQQQISDAIKAIFLSDENGLDWYEAQKSFSPDTIKVQFDEGGIITAFDRDVSKLWPINQSVAEISASAAPSGLSVRGSWVWCDGKITPRKYNQDELIKQADNQKNALLASAAAKMAPLQDAVDIGEATPDEVTMLRAWKGYRVALNRLDTGTAPDIVWPEMPGDVA